MTRFFRRFVGVACPLLVLAACVGGSRLRIPGDLARPPRPAVPAAGAKVAVADFSYAASAEAPEVIGRDYDQVREIVWKGEPGKAMADLVAGVLVERGIPVVRGKADAPFPDDAPVRISGTVRKFEVNTRRKGTFTIQSEATVALAVSASGPGVPRPWETTVTSSTSLQDVFPVPEDLKEALLSAANSAAEEAVRRLQETGMIAPAPAEGKGGDGTAR